MGKGTKEEERLLYELSKLSLEITEECLDSMNKMDRQSRALQETFARMMSEEDARSYALLMEEAGGFFARVMSGGEVYDGARSLGDLKGSMEDIMRRTMGYGHQTKQRMARLSLELLKHPDLVDLTSSLTEEEMQRVKEEVKYGLTKSERGVIRLEEKRRKQTLGKKIGGFSGLRDPWKSSTMPVMVSGAKDGGGEDARAKRAGPRTRRGGGGVTAVAREDGEEGEVEEEEEEEEELEAVENAKKKKKKGKVSLVEAEELDRQERKRKTNEAEKRLTKTLKDEEEKIKRKIKESKRTRIGTLGKSVPKETIDTIEFLLAIEGEDGLEIAFEYGDVDNEEEGGGGGGGGGKKKDNEKRELEEDEKYVLRVKGNVNVSLDLRKKSSRDELERIARERQLPRLNMLVMALAGIEGLMKDDPKGAEAIVETLQKTGERLKERSWGPKMIVVVVLGVVVAWYLSTMVTRSYVHFFDNNYSGGTDLVTFIENQWEKYVSSYFADIRSFVSGERGYDDLSGVQREGIKWWLGEGARSNVEALNVELQAAQQSAWKVGLSGEEASRTVSEALGSSEGWARAEEELRLNDALVKMSNFKGSIIEGFFKEGLRFFSNTVRPQIVAVKDFFSDLSASKMAKINGPRNLATAIPEGFVRNAPHWTGLDILGLTMRAAYLTFTVAPWIAFINGLMFYTPTLLIKLIRNVAGYLEGTLASVVARLEKRLNDERSRSGGRRSGGSTAIPSLGSVAWYALRFLETALYVVRVSLDLVDKVFTVATIMNTVGSFSLFALPVFIVFGFSFIPLDRTHAAKVAEWIASLETAHGVGSKALAGLYEGAGYALNSFGHLARGTYEGTSSFVYMMYNLNGNLFFPSSS